MKLLSRNLAVALWCGLGFLSQSFAAQPRLALVIGNSDYNIANGRLPNARGDAEQVAERLRGLGFEVILHTDLRTRAELKKAVEGFIGQASGREIALLFYSGHGVQYDDHNYLIPTQETISQAYQVEDNALSVDYLLKGLKAMRPQLGVVILDACRTNPFPKSDKGPSRGLTRIKAPSDIVVAYATEPGSVADDGDGAHSPYAQALLTHFQDPGSTALPVTEFFNRVGVTVEQLSGGEQSPRLELPPLHYSVCFRHCNDVAPSAPEPPQPAPAVPVKPKPAIDRYGLKMIPVTSGCFQMGSPQNQAGRYNDERQHEVCVENFKLGETEVTQGQWRAVMGSNPSELTFKNCGDDCPVESVSWQDVQGFITRLNEQTGLHYRLPSEAEWEYACRSGGQAQTYCGGETVENLAWYGDNSGQTTHPVKQKAANGLGFYDMSGNVWEWTGSVYQDSYNGTDEKQSINHANNGVRLVLRGGSWSFSARDVRSAYHIWLAATYRRNSVGFRLAQD